MASASKDAYKKSIFYQTIMDLNDHLDYLITSAELSHDCVNYSDSDPDHKQSNKVGLSEKKHTHILLLQPKQTRSR